MEARLPESLVPVSSTSKYVCRQNDRYSGILDTSVLSSSTADKGCKRSRVFSPAQSSEHTAVLSPTSIGQCRQGKNTDATTIDITTCDPHKTQPGDVDRGICTRGENHTSGELRTPPMCRKLALNYIIRVFLEPIRPTTATTATTPTTCMIASLSPRLPITTQLSSFIQVNPIQDAPFSPHPPLR